MPETSSSHQGDGENNYQVSSERVFYKEVPITYYLQKRTRTISFEWHHHQRVNILRSDLSPGDHGVYTWCPMVTARDISMVSSHREILSEKEKSNQGYPGLRVRACCDSEMRRYQCQWIDGLAQCELHLSPICLSPSVWSGCVCPNDQSISIITSPYNPCSLLPLNLIGRAHERNNAHRALLIIRQYIKPESVLAIETTVISFPFLFSSFWSP